MIWRFWGFFFCIMAAFWIALLVNPMIYLIVPKLPVLAFLILQVAIGGAMAAGWSK